MSATPDMLMFNEVPSLPIVNLLLSGVLAGKEKLAVVDALGSKIERAPIVVPEVAVSVTTFELNERSVHIFK